MTKKDEKDALGFRKDSYPFLIAVAIIVINVLAFESHNTLYIMGAIAVDTLMVWWLYKRFKNRKSHRGKK